MDSLNFTQMLEETYKQQKLDEKYEEAVRYFSTLNEEYLKEYLEKTGVPADLIQAYLNIDTKKRARNTYLKGWGAHKSDTTGGKSRIYDPLDDFSDKEYRRQKYRGSDVYNVNNTAYPEDDLEADVYDNHINTMTTGKYNSASGNLNSFTMDIDYGSCTYDVLNVDDTIRYLGISNVNQTTSAQSTKGVSWLTAEENRSEGLPSNEGRVAFQAGAVNEDTFNTNLSSLRFLFKDRNTYVLMMYDDTQLSTGKVMPLFSLENFPRACFDKGDLHLGFPKKTGQTTLDSKYLDRSVNGVLLLIHLADKIYKTDELQHRIINHEAASTDAIKRHLNFRYVGEHNSQNQITQHISSKIPSFDTLVNVITKRYVDSGMSTLSLSPLYNEYLYMKTLADLLNDAANTNDTDWFKNINTEQIKSFMFSHPDLFVPSRDGDTYSDPVNNAPFNQHAPLIISILKALGNYVNSPTIEDFLAGDVNADTFTFIKEIANIGKEYEIVTEPSGLQCYFTENVKDLLSPYKVKTNTVNYADKGLALLSRDATEKIYGELIDIYFPPTEEKFKRINKLYKRNIFNRLVITKPKRKGAYLRPNADNPENPNFINNFQSFKPLQNYMAVLNDDSNWLYDLILDTGDHTPSRSYRRDRAIQFHTSVTGNLVSAWQSCIDLKKRMLHSKKAYERVKKNKDSYTGEDAEEDYQDDLQEVKEQYESDLKAYKEALENKKHILDKYCSNVSQTTFYIERAIAEYFTILEDKLKLVRELKNKVQKLESYSLDDIFKEFKENTPALKEIEEKIVALQKLLSEQEQQLEKIRREKAEIQNRIDKLRAELEEMTKNLSDKETAEEATKQVIRDVNMGLKELNDAKQPDNAKAVSAYYKKREEAEEVCISLGNDIDNFRRNVFKDSNKQSTTSDNQHQIRGKKVETNPKILEVLDLMDETVSEVSQELKADEKDKQIIDTLSTEPDLNDIMDDGEQDSDEE